MTSVRWWVVIPKRQHFNAPSFDNPPSTLDNPPRPMASVHLDNVTKIYPNGVAAVDGVSLTVADHEFVALVGPSGCGKSTTLRLIAGLEAPDGGTIRIGDRDVTDVPPKDRDIAMVFQNYALYPHMTVRGNLSFALRLRRMPGLLTRLRHPGRARAVRREIDDRVNRAADLLDIGTLMDRKPRDLSGGQRQRVAVGRAIVRDPAAFLFDEPLSNLDARLRLTTRAELKRLHQRLRTTTVYVTHDQEEAMTLGDRIVVMRDGRIQQADPPLQTYHSPLNRFVAGFIGMPPMNFFDGTLAVLDNRLTFVEEGGSGPPAASKTGALTSSELTLHEKGFRVALPSVAPWIDGRMVGRVGGRVVLGIRPEHFSLSPIRSEAGLVVSAPLDVRLTMIEPLGGNADLYLRTAGHDAVVARVDAMASGRLPEVGSSVRVHVDLRRVQLFEPGEAGMNLSLEPQSSGRSATELAHAMA
ncbi:MAG: transporter related protein [Phycisphaerales bacterium]|nr:transporter related protein [Phycisphaerales bacterium]